MATVSILKDLFQMTAHFNFKTKLFYDATERYIMAKLIRLVDY